MSTPQPRWKAVRNLLVCLVAIGAGAWLLYYFALQPKAVVRAPAGSVIRVTSVQTGSLLATQRSSSPQTVLRLPVGSYCVTVGAGGDSEQFYDSTRLFQTNTYTLKAAVGRLSLVTKRAAYNALVTSSGDIDYLDTSNQFIGAIRNGLTSYVSTIDDNGYGSVQDMHVIRNEQAIVIDGNTLYLLHDSRLTPISTTGFPQNVRTLAIGTNPLQDSFVVAVNNTVYWYATPQAAPQRITTLSKAADQLAYGGDMVLAYSTRMPPATQDIRAGYVDFAVDPILINVATKTQRTIAIGPVVDASIAPGGKLATIEVQGAVSTVLYSLPDVTALYDIGNPDTLTPVWLDADHFVYGQGSGIWKLNVGSHSSTLLGATDTGQQPTSITYNSIAQIYLVTAYDASNGYLYELASN